MIKPWHDPAILTSLRSGNPLGYIDPTIRRRILDKKGSEGYDIAQDISQDIDALSGGSSYVAKAVHFDGATWLGQDPVNVLIPNSAVGGWSVYFKIADVASQQNFISTYGEAQNPITDFSNSQCNLGPAGTGAAVLALETAAGQFVYWQSANDLITSDGWHHLFMSWNTNFSQNNKIGNILLDGVVIADASNLGSDTGNASSVPWFDTNVPTALFIPDNANSGDPMVPFDFADFQFWDGTYIAPSEVSKFRDSVTGKPVNPSVAAAAFGPPSILFSGDQTTFSTNQGTGGAFTLTGALTNATTSPSD